MSRRKRIHSKPGKVPVCDCIHSDGTHEAAHENGCALFKPDWSGKCDNCGASPIVLVTGMCGPCSFGEADTIGGNW